MALFDVTKDPRYILHRKNLIEIYKKFFGYNRIDDKDVKAEIEEEATILATDLAKENMRFMETYLAMMPKPK